MNYDFVYSTDDRVLCLRNIAQESVRLNIPLLNGGNYVFWKTKLRAILVRDDLWNIVSEPKPENADGDWKKKNNKEPWHISR